MRCARDCPSWACGRVAPSIASSRCLTLATPATPRRGAAAISFRPRWWAQVRRRRCGSNGPVRWGLPPLAPALADVRPATLAPVEKEPAGGEVIDRAVLAEHRARRAEAAE